MRTYRNKNYKSRNYECSNILFVQAKEMPSDNWVECNEEEIEEKNCYQLYMSDGIRYFGYL